MFENSRKLVCALKVSAEDISFIHKNVFGKNFFGTHNNLGEYYDYFADMTDDVTENLIALGMEEPTIQEAVNEYSNGINERKFGTTHAYAYCNKIFNDMIKLFEASKSEVPDYIASVWENYQAWLHKTGNYLIAHRIAFKDEGQHDFH